MHIFAEFSVFASMKLDSRKAITRKFIISEIRKYIICATEQKMRASARFICSMTLGEHEQT